MAEKNSHVHGPAGTFPSQKLNVNNRTDVQKIINSKVHADHHHHHHSGTKSEIILQPQPSYILMLRCDGVGSKARTQLLQCVVTRLHTGTLIVYSQSSNTSCSTLLYTDTDTQCHPWKILIQKLFTIEY